MDPTACRGHRRARAAAAGLALVTAAFLPAPAWAVRQVDVVVNLWSGSGFDEALARRVVGEANKILREQLDVELNVAAVKTFDVALPGGVLPKEMIQEQTARGLEALAKKEVVDGTANDKGYKLNLVRRIDAGGQQGTEGGFSLTRGTFAFVAREAQDGLGNVGARTEAQMGQSLAHEIGHLGGLAGGHSIDADTSAGPDGHAPDQPGEDGRDNLMAAGRYRRGTKLTPAQKQVVLQNLQFSGKGAFHIGPFTPGQREPEQYGSAFDPAGDDGGLGALDLLGAELASAEDRPDVGCALSLGGAFPSAPTLVGYRLLFDTDADPGTGVVVHDVAGVDREAVLVVQQGPGVPVSASGFVRDPSTGEATPLPAAPGVVQRTVLGDPVGPGGPSPLGPSLSAVECALPKSLLGLEADQVPVTVIVEDDGGPRDRTALVFDQRRYQTDAALTLFQGTATPGATVPFEIARLTPDAPFTLFVNGEPALSGVVAPDGTVSGEFPLPATAPPGTFLFFLRAQDATGESAFNALHNGLPTVRLEVDRSEAGPGASQAVRLTISNLDAAAQVDVLAGALLPPGSGPDFGCALGDAAVFFAGPAAEATVVCLSAPVESFPALFISAALPGGLPKTEVPLLSFAWPAGAPAGLYEFFFALAPAGGFAAGDPTLIALATATVVFAGSGSP
jgi:hypothetical protein